MVPKLEWMVILPKDTDLERLAELLIARFQTERGIVAIAGPPGVGKSTFSEALRDRINLAADGTCEILPMDGFHFDDIYLNANGWRARKGAPHTFDVGGLRSMLARLQANDEHGIAVPVFDRDIEITRAGARMISGSVRIVLVEGNYLLMTPPPWGGLRQYFDVTVMLQVPEALLRSRLLARWTGIGFSEDEAKEKASGNDLLNVREVIENSTAADFSVNTEG